MSVKLRYTVVVEYDADPKDYMTEWPEEMVEVDRQNVEIVGPACFLDLILDMPASGTVVKTAKVELVNEPD